MRFLCAGAGSAGLGVCSQIVEGLIAAGLTEKEARQRFVICNVDGAFGRYAETHGDPHHKQPHMADILARWENPSVSDGMSLLDALKTFKPTVLLGLSTVKGLFKEELIKTMGSYCERPIIFPMSNPTNRCECTAEQAYQWTNGRAIVASGSPFEAVKLDSGLTLHPSQCNNMYIFPGIGLATSVSGITTITDKMFYEAALACARTTSADDIKEGRIFPRLKRIREVSHAVACAVIEEGIKSGLTTKISAKQRDEGIASLVSRKMYFPNYVPLL